MKNLKRILSLALASTMLIGMMVVGASAAGYSDAAEINSKRTEAVETLKALDIMRGNGGTDAFAPKGTLTRAEMAVIAAVAYRGARDVDQFIDQNGKSSFVDVPSGWMLPWIEYCANLGIIKGYGNGYFGPNDTVKAIDAVNLVLSLMGYKYNAETDGNYNIATTMRAQDMGLLKSLDGLTTGGNITREDMAQLVYNALDLPLNNGGTYVSTTVDKPNGTYKITGYNGAALPSALAAFQDTVFASFFEAYTVANNAMPNDYKVNFDLEQQKSPVAVTKAETLGHKHLSMDVISDYIRDIEYDEDDEVYYLNGSDILYSEEDPSDLLGLAVDFIVKVDKDENVVDTYGVRATGTTLWSGHLGEIGTFTASTKTIKLGTSSFKTTSDTNTEIDFVTMNGDLGNLSNLSTLTNNGGDLATAYEVKAASDNGKTIDRFVVYPVQYGTVTYLGKNQMTVSGVSTFNLAEVDAYEGMKVGDPVVVTLADNTVDGITVIEKPEIIEKATVTAADGTNKVQVNGTWYTVLNNNYTALATLSGTADLILINGYIVDYNAIRNTTTMGTSGVVMVADKNNATEGGTFRGTPTHLAVQVMNLDGEYEIVDVTKVYNGTTTEAVTTSNVSKYSLYTYGDDPANAGYVILYPYTAPLGTATKTSSSAITLDNGKLKGGNSGSNDYNINSDASFFVIVTVNGTETFKVLSGAELAALDDKYVSDTTDSLVYATTVRGFQYATLGVLRLVSWGATTGAENSTFTEFPGAKSELLLGWTTGNAIYTRSGNTTYLALPIWDGEEYRTINVISTENGAVSGLGSTEARRWTAGKPVSFKENSNGYAIELANLSSYSNFVSAWDEVSAIKFGTNPGTATNITAAWTILYVDTAKNEGVEGGEIQMARQTELGNWVKNVYWTGTLLVVDVNNQLAEVKTSVSLTADKDVIQGINVNAGTITLKNGATVTSVEAELHTGAAPTGQKGLQYVAAYEFVDGNGDPVTGALATGNILRISTESGVVYSLLITVQAP